MKAMTVALAAMVAALTGCQTNHSHSRECCAEQRFYPNGTAYPGSQVQPPANAPSQYMPSYGGQAATRSPSPRYPAMPSQYPAAPQQYSPATSGAGQGPAW